MNRICVFILVIIFSTSFNISAQEHSIISNTPSLSVRTTYSDLLNGIIISPSYSFGSGKHTLNVGPTLLLSIGDQIESRDKLKLSGVQATYQNRPLKRTGKLGMFILGDLILQRVKDEDTSTFFNANTSSLEPFSFEQTDTIVQLYTGYGLEWHFSQKLSLANSIAYGGVFTSRKTISSLQNFTDKFYDLDWIVKFELSYRL